MHTQLEQIELLNKLLRRDALALSYGGPRSTMTRVHRRVRLLAKLTDRAEMNVWRLAAVGAYVGRG